jgi:hypothetical protein
MGRVGIMPVKMSQEEIEIIYSRHRRKEESCLTFETFIRALIHIAKAIFPDHSNALKSLTDFFDQYFTPLSHLEDAIDDIPQITNRSLWEKDLQELRSLAHHFSKIYPTYWTNELVLAKNIKTFENE